LLHNLDEMLLDIEQSYRWLKSGDIKGCTIVPVIIVSTGIVTRSLRKNLVTLQGKHSVDSLQKTAILGTSHILRKVLQFET